MGPKGVIACKSKASRCLQDALLMIAYDVIDYFLVGGYHNINCW